MKKVLYIDDEVDTEKMASKFEIMAEQGIEVIKVENVESALPMIEKNLSDIGLIVLDVIMPPEDYYTLEETNGGTTTGFRLLQDIRNKYEQIPILIVSIRRKQKAESFLQQFHIVNYLEKPISAADLGNSIRTILSKS